MTPFTIKNKFLAFRDAYDKVVDTQEFSKIPIENIEEKTGDNLTTIPRYVPGTGLEPVRTNVHWILSPTCLPIPPPGQFF